MRPSNEPHAQSSGADATAVGWVVPPRGSRVDAEFVVEGTTLAIGRLGHDAAPVRLDLHDVVGLDAIGEPVEGLTEVELRMADGTTIAAGWTDAFCHAVVEALHRTVSADEHHDAPGAGDPPADARGELLDERPGPYRDTGPERSDGLDGSDGVERSDGVDGTVTSSSTLVLEDVVYLGGHPGQTRRRKRCSVSMDRVALELSGPSGLLIRIAWDDVRTIEVQNADEARFRMNTKIHRDASALVVECSDDVTVLFEARDCPTIALRSAISQLLSGLPVVVV